LDSAALASTPTTFSTTSPTRAPIASSTRSSIRKSAFKVAAIEPGSELVWLKPDSTWAWKLTGVDGGTRLVTRLRILYRWDRPVGAIASLVLNEVGDFPMMRKMLVTLRQRAEGSWRRAAPR
jgi:hypothetical protein